MTPIHEQELPSAFSIIWSRRKTMFAVTGLALAAGVAYTMLAPAIWEAKATIVFPVRTQSLLGTGSFEQQGLAATLTGGPTPLKIFGGMLESERALDFVAKGVGKNRRDVKSARTVQEQGSENSITIGARDKDPETAKKIVALHIAALKQINETVSKPLISGDATVISAQLAEQKKKLAAAEQDLLVFQQHALTAPTVITMGTGKDSSVIPTSGRWADMDKQLEIQMATLDSSIRDTEERARSISGKLKDLPAALPPVEKWRSKLIEQEYDLKVKGLTLANEAPEMVKLRKSIAVTKEQLQSELTKYTQAALEGLVDPTGGTSKLPSYLTQRVALEAQIAAVKKLAKLAPGEAIKLSQLTRTVTTQSAIVAQLQAQYQLASLQSDRDPNNWEVLDEPRVDDKAVNKSFSKNLTLSMIGGLALGALFALFGPRRKVKTVVKEAPLKLDEAA